MVFFTCNVCAEALKKNQVEKHVIRCRSCEVLSCVDCGKDFWGDDYKTHTKCLTENEKYCGKGYVPKVNKGEVKQEQWIEKVQHVIETSSSKLKDILEKLKDYPNIPRKKQKFENFLKNSLRLSNQATVNQLWELLMTSSTPDAQQNNKSNSVQQPSPTETEKCFQNGVEKINNDLQPDVPCENGSSKLSKRERKEERKRQANKKEKKDKNKNGDDDVHQEKKKKKRKQPDEEDEENVEVEKTSKKRKECEITLADDEVIPAEENDEQDTEIHQKQVKHKKKRFNWATVILDILQSKGEMSVKKLRKKVLNEFLAQDAANYAKENLNAKFEKKLNTIANIKVVKDRVKLK